MQKDPLVALLVGAICVSSLFALFETAGYEMHIKQLVRMQPAMAQIQNSQTLAGALMNDTMEYAKRNPAVNPIIQGALKPPTAPAAK